MSPTTTAPRTKKRTNVRPSWSTLAAVGAARALGSVWPRASARVAHRLWSHPQRYARPDREHAALATATPMDMPLGMGMVRGWTWGSGPTILLVHGWEGRGTQLSSLIEPLVQRGFRVATFDAPAHGDSDGAQASLFSFADAINSAARRLGPLHGLVAHSMGGAASLVALSAGLSVNRVVFIAPADASLAIERFGDAVGLADAVRQQLSRDLHLRYGAPLQAIAPTELAQGLTAPALIIHDEHDRFVPVRDGQLIATAWPGAQLHTTVGLGHHRILRDDAVVAKSVSFLTSPTAQPGTRS